MDSAAGDVFDYEFVVRNTGNVTLDEFDLESTYPELVAGVQWPGAEWSLLPDEEVVVTVSHTVTQAEIDAGQLVHSVTASAEAPDGSAVTDAAESRIVFTRVPAVSVELSPGSMTMDSAAGDVFDYEFVVRNTGNVTLDEFDLESTYPELVAGVQWPGAEWSLLPDEEVVVTVSHTVTQAEIDAGELVHSVTASAQEPGGSTVTDTADSRISFTRDGVAPTADGDTSTSGTSTGENDGGMLASTGATLALVALPVACGALGVGVLLMLLRRRRSARSGETS